MCAPIESTVQPVLLNIFIKKLVKVYDELLNIKERVGIAFGSSIHKLQVAKTGRVS